MQLDWLAETYNRNAVIIVDLVSRVCTAWFKSLNVFMVMLFMD